MKRKIILLCVGIIMFVLLDYINVPSIYGMKVLNMNWDFLNLLEVVVLYILTYWVLDERTVQRENNKKEIAILLIKRCYEDCDKYVKLLNQDTIEQYIIPKVDFNSTDNENTIIGNLKKAPFGNDAIIIDLLKDGQLTRMQIDEYLNIKAKYEQYISMRIVFYDAPNLYEPIRIELYKMIENESKRLN